MPVVDWAGMWSSIQSGLAYLLYMFLAAMALAIQSYIGEWLQKRRDKKKAEEDAIKEAEKKRLLQETAQNTAAIAEKAAEAVVEAKKTAEVVKTKIDSVGNQLNGDGLGGKVDKLISSLNEHKKAFDEHVQVDLVLAQNVDRIKQMIAKKTILKGPDDHTTDQVFTPGNPFAGDG